METEKMLFAEHLSLMIKGGASLVEALEILKKEARSGAFKAALAGILEKVLGGESLNSAMAEYPEIFDNFFRNIVKVGEESGGLESNLKYLAEKLRRDNEIRKSVRGAMIYPGIVVSLALAIAFSMAFFVLPQFINVFQNLKISLPLTTKILIASAVFLKKYWLFLALGLALSLFLLKLLFRVRAVKFIFDRLELSLPVLGPIFKNLNLSYISRTFYVLLKSGVPLAGALDILSETLSNSVYRQNLISVKAEAERGGKISDGLKKFPKTFPPVFSEMVLVGEKSGGLEDSLSYLAEYHAKEAESTLKNLATLVEPLLLILVGLFVALVVTAIIIPIYRFTGQIRFR